MRYYFDRWYTPTTPVAVKGGIKSSADKRKIAKNWWSKKWLEVLESFHIGARLSRGRSYARRGQVMSLNIEKGAIIANVQGSTYEPYKVEISFKQFTEKQWDEIIDNLKEKPIYCAQLINGKMPDDIEDLFTALNLTLLPGGWNDLESECSCPDWSNPCKHIAAVFYLMAEAFDKDPFLLFELRGMNQTEIMEQLGNVATAGNIVEIPDEPLSLEHDAFWGKEQKRLNLPAGKVNIHAAIPKRLGSLSFWRSDIDLLSFMEKVYHTASASVLKIKEKKIDIEES